VRHLLVILSLFLFSFTVISCSSDDEESSSDSDSTAPVIAEVTAVTTPTTDTTPDYTFSSDEAGTITYGGSCSSTTTSAIIGNNTITLDSLSGGTYSDCTITVTDTAGNVSSTLTLTSFTVDTTAPTVSSISPTDNQNGVSITDNISVTPAIYYLSRPLGHLTNGETGKGDETFSNLGALVKSTFKF